MISQPESLHHVCVATINRYKFNFVHSPLDSSRSFPQVSTPPLLIAINPLEISCSTEIRFACHPLEEVSANAVRKGLHHVADKGQADDFLCYEEEKCFVAWENFGPTLI